MIMRHAGTHALKFTDTDMDTWHAGIITKMRDCVGGHGFSSNLSRHIIAGTSILIAPFKR